MDIHKNDLKIIFDEMLDSIDSDKIRDSMLYELETALIGEFNRWYASGRRDNEQLEKILLNLAKVWIKYRQLNGGEKKYEYRIMGIRRDGRV